MAIDPLFTVSARLFIGSLFLATAIHKAIHYRRFTASVAAYGVLPAGFTAPVGSILAAAEFAVGVSVLAGVFLHFAAVGAMLVVGLYMVAMTINIARGNTAVDCGCSFSRREAPLSIWQLLRNAALMSVAALLLFPETPRRLGVFDGVQIVVAWGVFTLLYLSADALLSNRGYLARERT